MGETSMTLGDFTPNNVKNLMLITHFREIREDQPLLVTLDGLVQMGMGESTCD